MRDETLKLNNEQLEAVRHGVGPLLIIAGAGTGKTTVITERIKWLISQNLAKTSEILALTFTDKAAREMEERVDIAMPYGYTQMWISTFHAFCDRILRAEAVQIGLDPGYKLMTEAETVIFLRQNLFKFDLDYFRPLGNPTKFIGGMLQHFSRLKDEDVEPEQYLKYAQEVKSQKSKVKSEKEEIEKTMELAKAYQTYEELKIKEGVADFADLISNALKLLRTRLNVLREYQKQFKYILVDEFQDTNIAQYALLKALVPPKTKPNLTVVGDDSQCLPSETKILTPEGEKRIDQIKPGDKVLTAIGKGHTSLSEVKRVFKRKSKVKLLTFTLEGGKRIAVTDNHKMFCHIQAKSIDKDHHFVYLMAQKNLGWRLGVTNDLATRLRLEHHADKIIGIGSYKSDQEARFYEAYYATKYGLPTVPFSPRQQQAIGGIWLKRLFSEIDTEVAAQNLAHYLHLELDSPHFMVGGVKRGVTDRVKVNLQMCYRNYRSKTHKNGFVGNPGIMHLVWVETSSPEAINKLRKAGIPLSTAKKGVRFRFANTDLKEVWDMAEKLVDITGGILDKKFAAGTTNYQHKVSRIVPASHVLPGNYLPVAVGKRIIYKRVIRREEMEKELEVYDLEVEKTHNFVANGVVVHNSIYKFRGAAVSNILQFMDEYKGAKQVVLTKNYRSSQTILNHAYHLIKHNDPDTLEAKLGISKDLKKTRQVREEKIEFLHADRVENEAELVAKKIGQLGKEEKYAWSDFAILARANNHADPFVRALQRAGIPYQFLGPGMLFRQTEVKDLIAYLKLLYNLEDSVAAYRLLNMEFFDLAARDLASLTSFAKKTNLSLFEVCEIATGEVSGEVRLNIRPAIGEKTKENLSKIVKMVHRHLKLLPKETAGQILYYFLEDTGLLRKLTDYKTAAEEKKAQNISKFFDKLKTYEVDHEDASVSAVVDWIEMSLQLGESPLATNEDWTEVNAVNLLTVHSSKGLEFPVVFLVNLVGQRFPTVERREQIPIPEALIKEILPSGDSHLEEERRLFYVGMTRARDRLYLAAANYYGEGKRERKLSPFVFEALGEKISSPSTELRVNNQLSFLDWRKNEEVVSISPRAKIDYLSFSQIDTFGTCPLQYRYRFIQKIPVPSSGAQTFGEVIHKVLNNFYQLVLGGTKPKVGDLENLLLNHWSPLGYSSKTHEEQMKKRGERMLREFFEKLYNPKILPKSLEQIFTVRLSPDLKVGGRIDRVDEKDGKLEIIDYKTGRVPSEKEIKESLQMTVYALAATSPAIYGRKPEEVVLTFCFLEGSEKISSHRTEKQLEEAKIKLIEKAKEIENSSFSPTPGPWCDFCDFRLICEAWQ